MKTKNPPQPRIIRIRNKDIAGELDRIWPKTNGKPHDPQWIGKIRSGNAVSDEYAIQIPKAVANLQARFKA